MKEISYTSTELKGALTNLKKGGQYKGPISTLTKPQLMSALTSLNFPFNTLSSHNKQFAKSIGVKKRGDFIGPQNFVATKKRGRPTMIGPKLPRGMTYKKLAENYATEGNVELNKLVKSKKQRKARKDKGKKRGSYKKK